MAITPIVLPNLTAPQLGQTTAQIGQTAPALGAPAAAAPGASSFESVLGQAVQGLASVQAQADQQATALATGQNVSLVDTMLSMEQTSLDFRLALATRDKVVEAYQEVMRTQM